MVEIKIYAITAGFKMYKSIIKKKKKKNYKIELLGKLNKWNTVEVVISKALIYSYISHEEFISISNVWREYDEI